MKKSDAIAEVRIQQILDLTPNIREFTLCPADDGANSEIPHWHAGAHIQVSVSIGGEEQMRRYSLVGEPDGFTWKIAVKRMDHGRGGSKAMWALKVGETIQINGPHNFFPLDRSAEHYLLIAAGIGITPLIGILWCLFDLKVTFSFTHLEHSLAMALWFNWFRKRNSNSPPHKSVSL